MVILNENTFDFNICSLHKHRILIEPGTKPLSAATYQSPNDDVKYFVDEQLDKMLEKHDEHLEKNKLIDERVNAWIFNMQSRRFKITKK
jgi:hypothetical protein